MSVQDVYIQAATDCITLENSLDIFSMAGLQTSSSLSKSDEIPSWVTDWTLHTKGIKPINQRFLSALPFDNYQPIISAQSASCDTPATFYFSPDNKTLTLCGYIFDRITQVSTVLERDYFDLTDENPIKISPDPALNDLDLHALDPACIHSVFTLEEWEQMYGIQPDAGTGTKTVYPFTSQDPEEVFFQTTTPAGCGSPY
ncbi:hypothetical protein QBC38DRAFT_449853 [Podospora fimiseda]|uniref:Uncharacterized protein n=1 Tax=Podospora fimiseda TaxID=252190 RepID=A0AAN6YQR7_9PEZI|nr:hypothetical protein QBC38DRAFT_449853 [Podospora fimiseda]